MPAHRERDGVGGLRNDRGLALGEPRIERGGVYLPAQFRAKRAERVSALARPAGFGLAVGRDIKGYQGIMYEWRFAFLE